jgi:phytoene dehydrogenase-like protein
MGDNPSMSSADAAVIGSGPNGLAAAITLAHEGMKVVVFERNETVGGGCRTEELTLPGFRHDLCSAVHPLGVGSPFFKNLSLEQHGLTWVYPEFEMAHPLDDGSAIVLHRSVDETAKALGKDGTAYSRIMKPLFRNATGLMSDVLGPARPPRHPLVLAMFGVWGIRSVTGLAESVFEGERAKALLAGAGSHSILPLGQSPTAAYAITLLLLGHWVGWPMPRGGSAKIAEALLAELRSRSGEALTGRQIESMEELSDFRVKLFDVAPRNLARIAGESLPSRYRDKLNSYRHGPGTFKIDLALDGPIPWKAEECTRAGTIHLGGTLEEITESEEAVWRGNIPERPFIILAQPSLFDETRAPPGKHTVWAYCHVPAGSNFDMSSRIEDQVERFAPGFKDLILSRHKLFPANFEEKNPNLIGGDINGGVQDWRQLFSRPLTRLDPYSTPASDIFICSASTPPGGGVHGMCGYFAARSALKTLRG